MKKIIIIALLFQSFIAYAQQVELPWKTGLTRIRIAQFFDGKETSDIGANYVDGIILVDIVTNRAYVIGNKFDYFILDLKERMTAQEADKVMRTGISWLIYRCEHQDKEWIMYIRYDVNEDIVQTNFYSLVNDTIKVIHFDSKFIPQEKVE